MTHSGDRGRLVLQIFIGMGAVIFGLWVTAITWLAPLTVALLPDEWRAPFFGAGLVVVIAACVLAALFRPETV